jgi:hypothetical protein
LGDPNLDIYEAALKFRTQFLPATQGLGG